MPVYGFERDVAIRLKKKAGLVSTGGTGGKATLLPKRNFAEEDTFLFTMLANMGASDGTAEIRTMDDAVQISASETLVNTLGDFDHLTTSARGVCVRVDDVYYAVHPEEPGGGGSSVGEGHVFRLTTNLVGLAGQVANAVVTISGEAGVLAGASITVRNAGDKKAFIGADGFAVKIGSEYWVSEIDQYPILSQVELSVDTHAFTVGGTTQGKIANQNTITVSSMVALTPYPFSFVPSPFPTILNPYNLIGLDGDRAIVQYNESADIFQLLEILPDKKRRLRFKLSANMPTETITSTVNFTVLEAMEYTSGEVTTPGSIADPMKLIVNGKTNDEGVIEYDYRNEVWQVTSFRRRDASDCVMVVTPGSGIAARSGTTVNSATCNKVGLTGTTLGTTSGNITVYNPWPVAIPAAYYLMAKREAETGYYFADFPGVINVRWDSPDLEQTLDGTNYLNIDTAEACP
jgi:hypothetical protein